MDRIGLKKRRVFALKCSYLDDKTVILYRDRWHSKILEDHPEVADRLDTIRNMILSDGSGIVKKKKIGNSKRIALLKRVGYFQPRANYLKIALKRASEEAFEVTTVHSVVDDTIQGMQPL